MYACNIYSMVNDDDDDDDIFRESVVENIQLRCRYRHVVTRPHDEINNDGISLGTA